ncbi:hypothetical protein HN51_011586 [Arachis hypogaea]
MSLGGAATEEDANLIAKLFGSIGKIWKADEKYFDAVTGLRLEIVSNCNLHTINKDSVIEELVSSMGVCLSAQVKVESPYNTDIKELLEGYTPNDGKVIVVDKVLPAVPEQTDIAMAFRYDVFMMFQMPKGKE